MFSKKSNTATATATNSFAPPPGSDSCNIADGTTIEGTIKCSKGIRLDGKIIGDVNCDQRFVMGNSGKVEGTIKCNESVISGKIEGELSVKGLLHLLGTAFIKGKIMASKMIVDEGAKYSGECLIGEKK
ncbi:MAG: polymer-forming cytoskeletal protein [Saprospiraceae bacterium]